MVYAFEAISAFSDAPFTHILCVSLMAIINVLLAFVNLYLHIYGCAYICNVSHCRAVASSDASVELEMSPRKSMHVSSTNISPAEPWMAGIKHVRGVSTPIWSDPQAMRMDMPMVNCEMCGRKCMPKSGTACCKNCARLRIVTKVGGRQSTCLNSGCS